MRGVYPLSSFAHGVLESFAFSGLIRIEFTAGLGMRGVYPLSSFAHGVLESFAFSGFAIR